ncbi:hypothetical protein AB1Y20_009086 [Prymnesium parvum]|uniref:MYND-type domain-containing protein n=1 Tax=Prymnesium parvum TaxID=97485 RepID=A0AB34K0K9_PRYPA
MVACDAWPALEAHAASIHSVLKAWDDTGKGRCTFLEFVRAVQAIAALDRLAEVPAKDTLSNAFRQLALGEELLDLHRLLLEAPAPIDEDEFDPDDCFGQLHRSCACCGKLPDADSALARCQRCKKVRYCSRKCQLAAWKAGHNKSCGSRLPRPSTVSNGSVASSAAALHEFGLAEGSLLQGTLSRICNGVLDPEVSELSVREMHENAGVEAIVRVLGANQDNKELRFKALMLLSAAAVASKDGALAVLRAEATDWLVRCLGDVTSSGDPGIISTAVRALGKIAQTGVTGKEAVVDARGPFHMMAIMKEYQGHVELMCDVISSLGSVAYRGGIKCRKDVIWNSAPDGVVSVLRQHVTADGVNELLAHHSCAALRYFIAGDDAGVICGSAAELAHMMATAITAHLGIETIVDTMMWHGGNEDIQENGSAVIANICSVDLGAKRQAAVLAHSAVADTQASRNIVDALIPIVKAIRRFPNAPSPRHALQVITANLGSAKEALEAGADMSMLPLPLQFDKSNDEKL